MNDKEVKEKIMTLAKFKPNPNHHIIVDKWNRREYNKVRFEILNILEKEIDKRISQSWVENFTKFTSSLTETPTDFWESYKNRLHLWSSINTNCYFKLKEN